jgi:glycosyltransferase involved in cell wall biosynthesis
MKVTGICMCKDEADIIVSTVRHMAGQVDEVIVADNGSTDGTRGLLEALADHLPVVVIDDPDPAYYQAVKMTRLATVAADGGAGWVVPFDADEVWYSPFASTIAEALRGSTTAVVGAVLYDHVATGVDDDVSDPLLRIGWRRREAVELPKVACRTRLDVRIHQGNHAASYLEQTMVPDQLVVRHFPYRSVEQFIRKARNGAAAYAATDLPEDAGAHWRGYGRILDESGPEALAEVFRKWFWVAEPDASLIFDPAPCPAYQ